MDNIRLLEDRVERAVRRLRELGSEKERLENEVRSLREQLETIEFSPDSSPGEAMVEWESRRNEAVTLIRETLAELRAD